MKNEVLKLFNGLSVKEDLKEHEKLQEKVNEVNRETIPYGVIVDKYICYNYLPREIIDIVKNLFLTGKQINFSFHKSWDKIRNSPIEQLVLEQIVHYLTTYGFKALGVYDKDSVYIPSEKLNVPDIEEEYFEFKYIVGLTEWEIFERTRNLVDSGVALKQETVNDVVIILRNYDISSEDIENIKNKEVKTKLFETLGKVPSKPEEFLRYLVYELTGSTLLIKSNDLIESLKEAHIYGYEKIKKLLTQYKEQHGYEKLAEVFYRFKPIFLAFKTDTTKSDINKIRKLAKKYHKPMPEDYLNTVTEKIKKGEIINYKKLYDELDKVNTFRKIRLLYALRYRYLNPNSITYRVRNGKAYSIPFNFEKTEDLVLVGKAVYNSVVQDLKGKVEGKNILMPKNVEYALPATEKQFTGNFPHGTRVVMDSDFIVGIYWENLGRHSVDLDLSLLNAEGAKLGWDGMYRNGSILFSGDITDAPNGASELFYVPRGRRNNYRTKIKRSGKR